jgi:hypothetical protein
MSRYFRLLLQASAAQGAEEKRSKMNKISPKRLVGCFFQDVIPDSNASDIIDLLSPDQIIHNSEGYHIFLFIVVFLLFLL